MENTNTENYGYVFQGLFDASLYFILSVIYPILTFFIQINQANSSEITSYYDLVVTGLFFAATFFYDFYCRFRDCEHNTKLVVRVLSLGRTIFFSLSISLIFLLIISGAFRFPELKIVLYFVFSVSLYPLVISLVEIITRAHRESKGKISRAGA